MEGDNTDALQLQINSIGSRMESNFAELKEMLRSFDARLRNAETDAAGFKPVTQNTISAAWRRIDQHQESIDRIREALDAKISRQEHAAAMEQLANMKTLVDGLVLTAEKQETIIKWAGGIVATLISAGTIFLVGRLVWMAVTQTP